MTPTPLTAIHKRCRMARHKGYLKACLHLGRQEYVRRLVAVAFLGPAPSGSPAPSPRRRPRSAPRPGPYRTGPGSRRGSTTHAPWATFESDALAGPAEPSRSRPTQRTMIHPSRPGTIATIWAWNVR